VLPVEDLLAGHAGGVPLGEQGHGDVHSQPGQTHKQPLKLILDLRGLILVYSLLIFNVSLKPRSHKAT
jgi:hypothetical protein